MRQTLESKKVDNLDSIKGPIQKAEGPKAAKSLENIKTKYKHLKLVRGLGANLFYMPEEGKYAVVIRCTTKGCNHPTLVRTQDLFQRTTCTECRTNAKAKVKTETKTEPQTEV